MASSAFLVAATGSPETTAKSYSSFATEKEGLPVRVKAVPAAAIFRNLRRVIACLYPLMNYILSSEKQSAKCRAF
jgi:hypothetical protein